MSSLFDIFKHFERLERHKDGVLSSESGQIRFSTNHPHRNSSGFRIMLPTRKDHFYRVSIQGKVIEGNRVFIYCESALDNSRLIPRDYFISRIEKEIEIYFKANYSLTYLGILTWDSNPYEVKISQCQISLVDHLVWPAAEAETQKTENKEVEDENEEVEDDDVEDEEEVGDEDEEEVGDEDDEDEDDEDEDDEEEVDDDEDNDEEAEEESLEDEVEIITDRTRLDSLISPSYVIPDDLVENNSEDDEESKEDWVSEDEEEWIREEELEIRDQDGEIVEIDGEEFHSSNEEESESSESDHENIEPVVRSTPHEGDKLLLDFNVEEMLNRYRSK